MAQRVEEKEERSLHRNKSTREEEALRSVLHKEIKQDEDRAHPLP